MLQLEKVQMYATFFNTCASKVPLTCCRLQPLDADFGGNEDEEETPFCSFVANALVAMAEAANK